MPKKLSDLSKSVRQQKIYNILRHHTSEETGVTVTEIHHRLLKENVDTCNRTIKRDLEEMSMTHKFLATETMPARFYCSDDYEPDYQLTFNESELKTIALALSSLKQMAEPFQKSLCEKTETILLSKLPKEIAADFENLKALTIVSPSFRAESAAGNSKSYTSILRALKLGRVIQCKNNSPYKGTEHQNILRTFSPLKLNLVGSEQYLMAYDHDDKKIKRLKICRIDSVSILEEKIDKSLLSKLEGLENSIGGFGGPDHAIQKYVIHCDKLMATLFNEKKLHNSQTIEGTDDSYTITFESNPSIEIYRYLAGWAKHIKHVEPESAMQEMQSIWETGLQIKEIKKAA